MRSEINLIKFESIEWWGIHGDQERIVPKVSLHLQYIAI